MKELFSKNFSVGWADCDANGHARHSVYFDYPTDVRIAFFRTHGFPIDAWHTLGGAPILLEQSIKYHRELKLEEEISVNFFLEKEPSDPRFYHCMHEIFKKNGEKSATIRILVSYMDLKKRKIVMPPQEIMVMFKELHLMGT